MGLVGGRAEAQEAPQRVPDPGAGMTPPDLESFLRGGGEGWTAASVARLAVATAPSIASGRAQRDAAQAGADRALQAFAPRLTVSGRYTRLSPISQPNLFAVDPALLSAARALASTVSDPSARLLFEGNLAAQEAQGSFTFPVILDQVSFDAALTVPVTDLFLQVLPAYEAAGSAVAAARYQVAARASEVAQQAREAFYSLARARGALTVARAAVDAVEGQEQIVATMVRSGTASRVDLVRVQAQVAGARVGVLRAEAGARIAEEALGTLLHTAQGERFAIGEDLLAPLPRVAEDRDALVAAGLSHRPETLALRRLVHARGRQGDAAEGSRWPHFALAANLAVSNPNQRIFPQTQEFRETWDVSGVVSWSPNDFFTGARLADEAHALRSQAEADLAGLEDGVRMQVVVAFEGLRASEAAIEAARTGVAAADEALRVRTEQYRAGATVATELVLGVAERARAQLDLLNAALDARVSYSQLQRAIGADGPYDEAR